MKFTNRASLPDAIVQAVTNDPYNKGDADFTVTELLKPPRQRSLAIHHKDELVEDVSDRLWALYGQMGHVLLERAGMPNDITEERFTAQFGDWTVSAQVDSLSLGDGILTDWKFTTAWKFSSNQPPPADYCLQLNMQKRILEKNGLHVSKLQIGGMLRDWQISKAEKQRSYPQTPICIMPVASVAPDVVDEWIVDRIDEMLSAERELPFCSPEETWGGRRCKDYCNVNSFCSQYQDWRRNAAAV